MTSIVEVIQHYQRSIDSNQDNEARLLHCINKLYKLPIKVEHLQETGVGKTVNSLRKFNGEIGVAAKTLVTKWKAMVAAEEEPMDTTPQNNENGTPKHDGNDDGGGTTPQEDEGDENHNRNITNHEQQHQHSSKHGSGEKKDKHKDKHKERSSSSSGRKDSKTSSNHHSNDKSSKHSNDKHKTTSAPSSKDKDSQHKSSSISGNSIKDKEREKEKTDHTSNRDKNKDRDNKHNKDKEHSDKKRDEKSKTEKEHKSDSTQATHSSSHHNSNSHHSSNSSKPKHEEKHSHSSSKEKERSEKHKSSSKVKERTKDEKSSSHTSSKDNKSSSTSSTSKSSTKDSESSERKRRHNSDDSIEFKSPQPKMTKTQKLSKLESSPTQEDEGAEDSFDSSMGANFDDVLGMLNMPMKKSKKLLKSPTTALSSSSSSLNKKDTTPYTPSSSSGSSINKLNGSKTTNSSTSYSTPSTSKASTMKPDLLAPTAKLEPLDPSIALELPTISTNYKPLPLNQTVMDCVFNNSVNSKPVRTLSDAEAITHGISSKTIRTKIYSGIKTGQTYQVPTLFDMCIRILQKNIDALEYTGGVPFEVLKPVLERASPQQLYVFEEYNPYLMEDSDVLWQQHVSRTYRTKKRLENESWREMYIRCQEEEERRLSVLKDSIKASQKIAAAPVRKTQLAFVDSMVKPPRNILKKQEQYGTKSKLVATPAARVAALSSVTPNAAKTGDQRLKVPSTARDHAQVSSSSIKTKKAPLMQKTLQFIRGRHKR